MLYVSVPCMSCNSSGLISFDKKKKTEREKYNRHRACYILYRICVGRGQSNEICYDGFPRAHQQQLNLQALLILIIIERAKNVHDIMINYNVILAKNYRQPPSIEMRSLFM